MGQDWSKRRQERAKSAPTMKTLLAITGRKVFETAEGRDHRNMLARWPVLGALAPLEIRPLSRQAQLWPWSEAN